MLNVPRVFVFAEVSVHHHLHEEVAHSTGEELGGAGDDPVEPGQDEDAVPEPKHGENLVVYHVEGEDAESVLCLLAAASAVPLVVTHAN